MYNRLVASPGNALLIGTEGGVLLLSPPNHTPGAMPLVNLQNRTWHLLREPGPDTGNAAPTTGDFSISVVTRDLNIALAQFISQTGIAPAISERMAIFPVFPVLDYPVPPDLVSISRIEYQPYGQQPYKLIASSFEQFDELTGGMVYNGTGQPYYFRTPFAGYIRLQPQPGPGNATGPPAGVLTLQTTGGAPTPGQGVYAKFVNGPTTVTTATYTVQNGDSFGDVINGLIAAINASPAVAGTTSFLQAAQVGPNEGQVDLLANSQSLQALGITYAVFVNGAGALSASPGSPTYLQPTGDTMMFYYSSLGTVLVNPGDTPGIPPQFHMALVYRVLVDYWKRKQDFGQAKAYQAEYDAEVRRAKMYGFDSDRSSQPTIGGFDETDYAVPY